MYKLFFCFLFLWFFLFFAYFNFPAKMRLINSSQVVKVPKEVDVSVRKRVVTVKGPRGVLKRSFASLQVDIQVIFFVFVNFNLVLYTWVFFFFLLIVGIILCNIFFVCYFTFIFTRFFICYQCN